VLVFRSLSNCVCLDLVVEGGGGGGGGEELLNIKCVF